MTKTYDRVLGIDFGNGNINIYASFNGEPYELTLPSSFMYKKDYGEAYGVGGEIELDEYNLEGQEYLWGKDLEDLEVINTFGHENRYSSKPFKTITQLALARAVRDLEIQPNEKILVVTGVPTKEKGNEKVEKALANAVRYNTVGLNKVAINNVEFIFNVEDVLVMPQALSSVLGFYYALDGSIAEPRFEDMKVAVVDIGGGTIDLEIIHKLRRLKAYDSIPVGFRDVYDMIREEITAFEPTAKINDYKLLKLITDERALQLDRYVYKPSRIRNAIEFTKSFHEGLDYLTVKMHEGIMNTWKNQSDLDMILIVGGSAELFKERLDNVMEGFVIPKDSGMTNARGYHNYGQAYASYAAEQEV